MCRTFLFSTVLATEAPPVYEEKQGPAVTSTGTLPPPTAAPPGAQTPYAPYPQPGQPVVYGQQATQPVQYVVILFLLSIFQIFVFLFFCKGRCPLSCSLSHSKAELSWTSFLPDLHAGCCYCLRIPQHLVALLQRPCSHLCHHGEMSSL